MTTGGKKIKIINEALWLVLGQIASAVGGLYMVKVLTTYYSPSDYGVLMLALSAVALITQVGYGGINAACARYYSLAMHNASIKSYIKSLRRILMWMTLIGLMIATIAAIALWLTDQNMYISLSIVVAIYAISSGSSAILNSVLNAARWRAVAVMHQAIDIWGKISIIVIMMATTRVSIEVVLTIYSSICILLTFSQYIVLTKFIDKDNDINPDEYQTKSLSLNADMLKFAIPFAPWTLVIWMQQASERWFLQIYDGLTSVGIYSVLYQLGYSPIVMIFAIFIRFIQPVLYDQTSINGISDNVDNLIKRLTVIGISSGIIGAIAIASFHRELLSAFSREEYTEYSHLLPYVFLAGSLFGVAEIILQKMQSELRAVLLSKVKTLLGVFGIIINLIGVYFGGIYGIVYSTLTFSVLNLFVMHIASARNSNH